MDIGVLDAFQVSATGDMATLVCGPEGLQVIDQVDGLSHAELEALIGLPVRAD